MIFTQEYLFTVPDYYKDFACKAEKCRRSCCLGWHVTMPMNDYFRLLGMECPPAVRERLDRAMHVFDRPAPERYAEFSRTYTGDCPLLCENGLCMIQRECGEDAMPTVCRYYPRSPRTSFAYECALSASCEAVCELLFAKKEPMSFTKAALAFSYPLPEPRSGGIAAYYKPVRKVFISALQDRRFPVSDRLAACEKLASALQESISAQDGEGVERLLELRAPLAPERFEDGLVSRGFDTAKKMLLRLSERYPIEKYAFTCETDEYKELEKEFLKLFPAWETMCEQLLVNHVFYDGFPFYGELKNDIRGAFASLAALYAVWKVSAVCSLARGGGTDALADLTSEIFRMAENSNFNISAVALLADGKGLERGNIKPLLAL